MTQIRRHEVEGVKEPYVAFHNQFPYITKELLDSTSTRLAWKSYKQSGSDTKAVGTPILSHTDLACNPSYHSAASRTVFPRVSPYHGPGPFAPFGSRI